MYTENALLFPKQAIPLLRDFGDLRWQALVKDVLAQDECHEKTLAFMLMMIRLNGCLACETDSYRAMRGCISCAQQTLRRYQDIEEELVRCFTESLNDIRLFAKEHPTLEIRCS